MNGITELAKLLKESENSDGYSSMFGTVFELPNTKIRINDKDILTDSHLTLQVKVTVTGALGSVISVGDKVASDSLIFSAIENVEIGESGTADVTVICDTAGTVGNIPQGAINRFPVTLSGIVSVTNNEPATGGFNEETDDELRDRYFEKVSLPATSGSKYHYEQWAKEISSDVAKLIDGVQTDTGRGTLQT